MVRDQRIVECGRANGRGADGSTIDVDFGEAAIIPPLVNAHTHLEFSHLTTPVPAGANFAEWIDAVISERTTHRQIDPLSEAAVRRGLRRTQRHACFQVGEISTAEKLPAGTESGDVDGVQFLELLGASADRVAEQLANAEQFLESRSGASGSGFRPGLSPHAPYSTSMELVAGAVALARKYEVPIAMHLAETPEEMQLLASQDGPLADFLFSRKIWPPPHISRSTSPMEYLELLAAAPQALVIHGNYLSEAERAFVANQQAMSIVFCPRTHAYFGHPKYPLAETIWAGANVVLGTDSCASNPDLDIWAEAQFVAERYPEVPPYQVLPMVTTAAARAMGAKSQVLEPGQPADFAVISELPGDVDQDPFTRLLASPTNAASAWRGGNEMSCK